MTDPTPTTADRLANAATAFDLAAQHLREAAEALDGLPAECLPSCLPSGRSHLGTLEDARLLESDARTFRSIARTLREAAAATPTPETT
jgi:hypothetical protein